MKKKYLALALTATFFNYGYAQETKKNEDAIELEAIEVVDTAFQAQVRSITSEKLENMQATDVKDILKTMPSVIVDGAARYSQKVYVRGLEDKFANITIDGARLTGELFHHSGDQTIDAEMLKISEVELGPNSALSGAGVINGSFVYETKDPADMLSNGQTFGGKFSLGYQSGFDRNMANLSLYGTPNDRVQYLLSGNIVDDKKLKIPDNNDVTSKQSRLKSGLGKIVIKLTDDMLFDLSYNHYEDGGNRQLSGEKPGNNSNKDNIFSEIKRETVTGKFYYNPNSMIDLSVKLYSNDQELEYDEERSQSELINGKWKRYKDGVLVFPKYNYINSSSGIDIRNRSIINDNHMLTYGIEISREEQEIATGGSIIYIGGKKDGQTTKLPYAGKGKVDLLGFYIEDEMSFNRWIFNMGARFDKYELGGIYHGSFSQFSPKVKAAFQTIDKLTLRTGYGRIFRGPQLGETVTLNYHGSAQDANTKPATGHNVEIGMDYDLSNTIGANHSLLGFTAYRYTVDNYAHPTKNNILSPQGDMSIWGIETVLTVNKENWNMNFSHTYTDGEMTLKDGTKYEPRTAKIHTFKVDTDYRINDQWSINYNGQFVPGNKFNGQWGKVKRSGYSVHNIGATHKLLSLKGAKINIGIDNLFDKKYSRHTAFGTYFGNPDNTAYEVGRSFKVDFSYKF